jgi:hypothetical protein
LHPLIRALTTATTGKGLHWFPEGNNGLIAYEGCGGHTTIRLMVAGGASNPLSVGIEIDHPDGKLTVTSDPHLQGYRSDLDLLRGVPELLEAIAAIPVDEIAYDPAAEVALSQALAGLIHNWPAAAA